MLRACWRQSLKWNNSALYRSYCLEVQVLRDRTQGTITITQTKYIEEILSKFNLASAKPVATPLAVGEKLSVDDQPSTEQEKDEMRLVPRKSAVGCLIYLNVWTRFDIAKATQYVAQHSQNPGKIHWSAVKRVYRYLSGTRHHGITYKKSGRGVWNLWAGPTLIGQPMWTIGTSLRGGGCSRAC